MSERWSLCGLSSFKKASLAVLLIQRCHLDFGFGRKTLPALVVDRSGGHGGAGKAAQCQRTN
jgi:hypothetical protein